MKKKLDSPSTRSNKTVLSEIYGRTQSLFLVVVETRAASDFALGANRRPTLRRTLPVGRSTERRQLLSVGASSPPSGRPSFALVKGNSDADAEAAHPICCSGEGGTVRGSAQRKADGRFMLRPLRFNYSGGRGKTDWAVASSERLLVSSGPRRRSRLNLIQAGWRWRLSARGWLHSPQSAHESSTKTGGPGSQQRP